MATTTELLSLFRDEVDDTLAPFLWSTEAFYSYLDDAQKMFCRLTEGIEDSTTPAITQLSIVPATTPGTDYYAISPLILKIRGAFRSDDGTELPILTAERARTYKVLFDQRPGKLVYLFEGFEKHKLRCWPWPTETLTVNLVTFRLPLNTLNDDDQQLEIDAQHHRHLLLWCKGLAYDKQDTETYDKRKAADYKAAFKDYCAQALREQERARRVSNAVAYGGIPMGDRQSVVGRTDYFNRRFP